MGYAYLCSSLEKQHIKEYIIVIIIVVVVLLIINDS